MGLDAQQMVTGDDTGGNVRAPARAWEGMARGGAAVGSKFSDFHAEG
jgi:hypothetical protein